jgi:hypothetical protein
MGNTDLIRRLWRNAGFSGGAWLVTFLFAPVTTVCLSWRPRSGWEYLAASALQSPWVLAALFFFSLSAGFTLTALFCRLLNRRHVRHL